jgi:hypothetical protein
MLAKQHFHSPLPMQPISAKATQELKFHFESSENDTYWSTIGTMKSYVANILAPYFESHHQQLGAAQSILHLAD